MYRLDFVTFILFIPSALQTKRDTTYGFKGQDPIRITKKQMSEKQGTNSKGDILVIKPIRCTNFSNLFLE